MNRRTFLKTHLVGAAALASGGFADAAEKMSIQQSKPGEVKTGGSRLIPIDNGKFHVWTKKIGHGKIKMLTLHGGPGFTHEYFECFEDFLPQEGVEFYYYDQLGSHYSDQPTDTSLWTIPRFVDEVEQVRVALGLDKFYLYGHSWGSMLGIEYALKYGQHLKGLILASMTGSIAAYNKYAAKLRAALPPDVIAILGKYERKNDFENPEYQQTMLEKVYSQHVCRINPWPEPVQRAFRHLNEKIYNYMQGPNEFVITGTFKDWDRWNDLPKIETPTLVIGGRYDEMNPEDLKREAALIPNARLAICENGSHLSMYDDQASYFQHLISFVRENERGIKIGGARSGA
jgi:proline iminopeptidase